jgi:hypothetical protein
MQTTSSTFFSCRRHSPSNLGIRNTGVQTFPQIFSFIFTQQPIPYLFRHARYLDSLTHVPRSFLPTNRQSPRLPPFAYQPNELAYARTAPRCKPLTIQPFSSRQRRPACWRRRTNKGGALPRFSSGLPVRPIVCKYGELNGLAGEACCGSAVLLILDLHPKMANLRRCLSCCSMRRGLVY